MDRWEIKREKKKKVMSHLPMIEGKLHSADIKLMHYTKIKDILTAGATVNLQTLQSTKSNSLL